MSPGVAVVIPAYNAGPFLAQALSSLEQQTLPPDEVVVVDDGSTDDTVAVAEAHGANVVRQRQRGPGAARNSGIAATTAPWIAFLDADDLFLPDKLERQVAHARAHGLSAVCCDAFVLRDGRDAGRKNARKRVPAELSFARLIQSNPVICSSVLVEREAVAQAGGFDEDPQLIATEDFDLWLRLAKVQPLGYLDEPLCRYRVHGSSLSANDRFLRGVDRILDKHEKDCAGDARLAALLRRRRAMARLDLAYDLMQPGRDRDRAQALIREAQSLSFSWKGLKMRLLTGLGR